eukprot:gene3857-755_t
MPRLRAFALLPLAASLGKGAPPAPEPKAVWLDAARPVKERVDARRRAEFAPKFL